MIPFLFFFPPPTHDDTTGPSPLLMFRAGWFRQCYIGWALGGVISLPDLTSPHSFCAAMPFSGFRTCHNSPAFLHKFFPPRRSHSVLLASRDSRVDFAWDVRRVAGFSFSSFLFGWSLYRSLSRQISGARCRRNTFHLFRRSDITPSQ